MACEFAATFTRHPKRKCARLTPKNVRKRNLRMIRSLRETIDYYKYYVLAFNFTQHKPLLLS